MNGMDSHPVNPVHLVQNRVSTYLACGGSVVWYSQSATYAVPDLPVVWEIGFFGVRCDRRAVPGNSEGGGMRVYWELAKLGVRRASTYRAAAVSGAITNAFFGFLRAYIFTALYGSRTDVAGYTLAD